MNSDIEKNQQKPDYLNLIAPHLIMQLNIHKSLGEIAYLIGAGLGLMIFLLGIIGSLLILGVSKNSFAWIIAAISLIYCIYIFWQAQKIEKNVAQRTKESVDALSEDMKKNKTDPKP